MIEKDDECAIQANVNDETYSMRTGMNLRPGKRTIYIYVDYNTMIMQMLLYDAPCYVHTLVSPPPAHAFVTAIPQLRANTTAPNTAQATAGSF